jgi:hypothetical protein
MEMELDTNKPHSESKRQRKSSAVWRVERLVEQLAQVYAIVGREVPPSAALAMMAAELSRYTEAQTGAALMRVARECRFVSLAEIIERIPGAGADDGRPDVEEAWAMIPKYEEASVVWSTEMSEAFGAARQLVRDGDLIGARMTFKEVYPRFVAKARRENIPVRWMPSLGWDLADRTRALAEAVQKNRMTAEAAFGLLGPEQQAELALALPAAARLMLPGEAKPPERLLPGFAGVLQKIRMDGLVPEGCDPGPPKPERRAMTPDELMARRQELRAQAEAMGRRHDRNCGCDSCESRRDARLLAAEPRPMPPSRSCGNL